MEGAKQVGKVMAKTARVGGAIAETAGAARGLYEAARPALHKYDRHLSTIDKGLQGYDRVRRSLAG